MRGVIWSLISQRKELHKTQISKETKDTIIWQGPTGADDYPNVAIRKLANSDTAKACYRSVSKYTYGEGFVDEISKAKVNEDETFAQLAKKVADDLSTLNCYALHIRKGKGGNWVSAERVNPAWVRLNIPENGRITKVTVCPDFGTNDFKKGTSQINEYPLYYEGLEAPEAIVWYAKISLLDEFYPIPYSDNDLDLFEADRRLVEGIEANLRNNFLASWIMKFEDEENKVVEPATEDYGGRTYGDVISDALNEASGSESAGALIKLFGISPGTDVIEAVPVNTNSDLFQKNAEQVIDKILRMFHVPPLIASVQVAGKLGNSNEIVNSIRMMNLATDSMRQELERVMNMISRLMLNKEAGDIKPLGVSQFTDVSTFWMDLTQDERRNYIQQNTSIELEDSGMEVTVEGNDLARSVGGAQALLQILAPQEGAMPPSEPVIRWMLQYQFGFSLEAIDQLMIALNEPVQNVPNQ